MHYYPVPIHSNNSGKKWNTRVLSRCFRRCISACVCVCVNKERVTLCPRSVGFHDVGYQSHTHKKVVYKAMCEVPAFHACWHNDTVTELRRMLTVVPVLQIIKPYTNVSPKSQNHDKTHDSSLDFIINMWCDPYIALIHTSLIQSGLR